MTTDDEDEYGPYSSTVPVYSAQCISDDGNDDDSDEDLAPLAAPAEVGETSFGALQISVDMCHQGM